MSKKGPEYYLDRIKECCRELGWKLAITNDGAYFTGLVIGSEQYIDNVCEGDEDFEDYMILDPKDDSLVVEH